jgi:hypothetical protein
LGVVVADRSRREAAAIAHELAELARFGPYRDAGADADADPER